MSEIGIDISKKRSKNIKEFRNKDIDIVVTVCSSNTKVICPFCASPMIRGRPEIINVILPGAKHYFHQAFDDPSEVEGTDEERMAAFRQVRDDIEKWIFSFFANLKIDNSKSQV
jgi:arsenate reductase